MKGGLAGVAILFASGCVNYQPTEADLRMASLAPPPISMEAAEVAIRAYFGPDLRDPDTALYRLQEPVNSYLDDLSTIRLGWFVCGEINAKNAFGGYVGYTPFWAHFDFRDADKVDAGSIGTDGELFVVRECEDIVANRTPVKWLGIDNTITNITK